jgi:hypothetical protein
MKNMLLKLYPPESSQIFYEVVSTCALHIFSSVCQPEAHTCLHFQMSLKSASASVAAKS